MVKPTRTVLARAMEALAEKYPREKPTQVRLAKLAGVKQPTVNEWGEEDRYPAMPTAVRLAKALDVCTEWLLSERGPKYAPAAPPPEIAPIMGRWKDLSLEQRRQIARFMEFIQTEE